MIITASKLICKECKKPLRNLFKFGERMKEGEYKTTCPLCFRKTSYKIIKSKNLMEVT